MPSTRWRKPLESALELTIWLCNALDAELAVPHWLGAPALACHSAPVVDPAASRFRTDRLSETDLDQYDMIYLALILLLSVPRLASAQECTSYDACALWVSGGEIFEGSEARKVDDFGFINLPDLSDRFARSDSAMFHQTRAADLYGSGNIMALGGALLWGTGYAVVQFSDHDEIAFGISLVGLVGYFWGNRRRRQGVQSFSRAIWWYNGELDRP